MATVIDVDSQNKLDVAIAAGAAHLRIHPSEKHGAYLISLVKGVTRIELLPGSTAQFVVGGDAVVEARQAAASRLQHVTITEDASLRLRSFSSGQTDVDLRGRASIEVRLDDATLKLAKDRHAIAYIEMGDHGYLDAQDSDEHGLVSIQLLPHSGIFSEKCGETFARIDQSGQEYAVSLVGIEGNHLVAAFEDIEEAQHYVRTLSTDNKFRLTRTFEFTRGSASETTRGDQRFDRMRQLLDGLQPLSMGQQRLPTFQVCTAW